MRRWRPDERPRSGRPPDRPSPRRPLATAALAATLSLAAALAACAPRAPAGTPGPATTRGLPPIPAVDGPLAISVAYPAEGGEITTRDSTFVFGAVGTGTATLRINGTPVPVEPNGAFLAFLPVPLDGIYRFAATAHGQTATLQRHVRIPPPPPVPQPGLAEILPGTAYPTGARAAPAGEPVQVGFRGTPGGRAALVLSDGTRVPLAERRAELLQDPGIRDFDTDPIHLDVTAPAPFAEYRGVLGARAITAADPNTPRPAIGSSARAGAGAAVEARLELIVDADTARTPLPLNLAVLEATELPPAVLFDPALDETTDRAIVGRPGPDYTYLYFWPNGTEVLIDAQDNDEYRVRLTPELTAWVSSGQVRFLPAGSPPPGGPVGTVRLDPRDDALDVRVELPARLPFLVIQHGRSVQLRIFNGRSNTARLQYGPADPFILQAEWRQPADAIYLLELELAQPPWGYQTFWAPNGDLVLRIRRPPEIDPRRPLHGLLIAVDPGHPPGGALGPTGLTEAQANLAIALALQPLLEAAGARVLMTRTGDEAVPLHARTRLATHAGAHILISIHNNAFPDGVNPFTNNGTSTYYFHPASTDLARDLQIELLAALGLRDLGIGRASLALVRPTWMPSALTESMFLMIPRQEAALRDPAVQQRIARAHLHALESFLLSR